MLPLLMAATLAADPTPAKEPAASVELFAKEAWYKDQEGKEQSFVGVLKFTPPAEGVVGFGRMNPFRLELSDPAAKPPIRAVYVGGDIDRLKPYAGKTVKLTGKAVDLEVEGSTSREIWPARLEVVPPPKAPPAPAKEAAPAKPVGLASRFYRDEPGEERTFEGELLGPNGKSAGYRIKTGKSELPVRVEEAKADLLKPFVGQRVKLTGKLIVVAAGFRVSEFVLPNMLDAGESEAAEPPPEKAPPEKAPPEKVPEKPTGTEFKALGRAALAVGPSDERRVQVIRTRADFVKTTGGDDEAKETAGVLAKAFKVPVDFDKQMLIVLCAGQRNTGGFSVEVLEMIVVRGELVVQWRVKGPKPDEATTDAITYPALTVLTARWAGPIRLEELGKLDDTPPVRVPALVGGGTPADARDVKILARTPILVGSGVGRQAVIRSEADLAAAVGDDNVRKELERLAKAFGVRRVDFEKHMLITIAAEKREATGGHRVEVQRITESGDSVVVDWRVRSPLPGVDVIQVVTYPDAETVLAERATGTVRFVPANLGLSDK